MLRLVPGTAVNGHCRDAVQWHCVASLLDDDVQLRKQGGH